jgi:Phage tail tube protein
MSNAHFVQSIERFGGMYGSAYKDGIELLDAIEVSGATDIQRIDMPMVGRTDTGRKPGREASEGTMRVQKFDATWELFVHEFLSTGLDARRAAQGTPAATLRTFDLKIQYHDPETRGKEVWQLEGCQIWRMQLGFSITDEVVEREYPLTWQQARPLETFKIDRLTGATIQVHTVNG